MDGRALERDPNPAWMGYSVGHWDGDTLVVESNGYNDRTWLDHDGHPHTEALRMTERYRRRDFGHMDVEVTYPDPKAYARPWTVAVRAELAADTEMIEFVCGEREANPGLAHWVGKASDEHKDEVKVAPDVLAKYVGHLRRAAEVLAARGADRRHHGVGRHAVRQHGRARRGAARRAVADAASRPVRPRRRVRHRRRRRADVAVREARVGRLPVRPEESVAAGFSRPANVRLKADATCWPSARRGPAGP